MSRSGENYCCHACIGDPFLSARINAEGKVGECAQCGEERKGVTECILGDWIEIVLESHFQPGDGETIAEIIEEITGLNQSLSEEIADSLGSVAGYRASGGETFYDSDDGYVVSRDRPDKSVRHWERFIESIRSEARFFNRTAETWLDHIFGSLSQDRTWGGKEVFKTFPIGTGFYRARHVADIGKAFEVLANPATLLGPLPNGKGSSGRMNAAGVSVFYGALDLDTCIAEIRPPVGSIALSARFDLMREVRLLDFDLLAAVQERCSHFDPEYDAKQERALFLRAFGFRIAQPVMPDDEAFGYLPTQIVADYLAQRPEPAIDGLLFRSTQTGGKGRNIVLFNRASRVGTDQKAKPINPIRDFRRSEFDDLLDDAPTPIEVEGLWVDLADERLPTLHIAVDSIEVSDINAVRYDENRRPVGHWQIELEESDRDFLDDD